ncbi:hypothetical protein U1Q18_007177 [Sarracenia purpurea var. burkii]
MGLRGCSKNGFDLQKLGALQRNRWVLFGGLFSVKMSFVEKVSQRRSCSEDIGLVRIFNGDLVVEGFFDDLVSFSVLWRRREQRCGEMRAAKGFDDVKNTRLTSRNRL